MWSTGIWTQQGSMYGRAPILHDRKKRRLRFSKFPIQTCWKFVSDEDSLLLSYRWSWMQVIPAAISQLSQGGDVYSIQSANLIVVTYASITSSV